MRHRGHGFSVELPPEAVDVSSYTFSFPDLGELPPVVTIRRESALKLDLAAHRAEVLSTLSAALLDLVIVSRTDVNRRGDWEYFTHVVEFGDAQSRMRQKELHLLVRNPAPVLYVFTGTDFASNFARLEPCFDAMVRSFRPDDPPAD